MNKQALTDWHDKEWWPRYQNFVSTPYKNQWGAGGKGKSQTKILQLNPSEDLRGLMIAGLIAQTRHRKLLSDKLGTFQSYDRHTTPLAKGGATIYQNRQSSVYIHNKGWVDEVPPIEAENVVRTNKCHCGKDVHGPSYKNCTYHENFIDGKMIGGCSEELRKYYKKHPEIKIFNREQSILFIRQTMMKVGR